jgi:hypothetical protein
VFLAIIFGVGISQPAMDIAQGEHPQVLDVFTRPPTEKNLRAYERDVEDASRIIQGVRPYMQFAQFLALKDLGKDVLAGRDGWFFYKPDVQFLIEPWSGYDDVIGAIRAFRDALDARGIRLLVVPAPGKPSIYPDKITARAAHLDEPVSGLARKPCARGHARETIARLRQAGVDTVDLFTLFEQNRATTALYLKQDTHWSPDGMCLAVDEVASEILARGWLTKGPVNYTLRPVSITRHGDVLRMARSPQVLNTFPPEQIECTQVTWEDTDYVYEDSPESDVLVLGDSFLRIYERDEPGSAGFTAHLALDLGLPLTSIINDGGASTLVRQELSRKPALLRYMKVVVWEFVERDLRFGTEGWQIVPLPDPIEATVVVN